MMYLRIMCSYMWSAIRNLMTNFQIKYMTKNDIVRVSVKHDSRTDMTKPVKIRTEQGKLKTDNCNLRTTVHILHTLDKKVTLEFIVQSY